MKLRPRLNWRKTQRTKARSREYVRLVGEINRETSGEETTTSGEDVGESARSESYRPQSTIAGDGDQQRYLRYESELGTPLPYHGLR